VADFPAKVDVAVVGGGPAGCAAALTLERYTRWRVVLIERSTYTEPRIGETVSGALGSLLEYLGALDTLSSGSHLQAFGTAAAWGSPAPEGRNFLFTAQGPGWHLDRLCFDRSLAATVERTGATVLLGTSVRIATFADDAWQLELTGGARGRITAQHIVDATGRSASIARRVGARRQTFDKLVGLSAYLDVPTGQTLEQVALIEAVSEGWWYSAPVPGGVVVAFMTDADALSSAAMNPCAFMTLLRQTSLTATRLSGCVLTSGPRASPAGSHVLKPCLGRAWIAAGDAVAAFDPLSSLGVGHALASGIQAARIVDGRLNGDETLASAYPADVSRHVGTYLEQRRTLYRFERRWPDRPFWARRQKVL